MLIVPALQDTMTVFTFDELTAPPPFVTEHAMPGVQLHCDLKGAVAILYLRKRERAVAVYRQRVRVIV